MRQGLGRWLSAYRWPLWVLLAFTATVPAALAGGRLGNAARNIVTLPPGRGCRVFMGRGMIVPASPADFFMLPADWVDAAAPTSRVYALPAASPSQIPVSWTGVDGADGAGIATYDVFVAADSGSFALWIDDTPASSGLYPGTPGHTYSFYCVATDWVGHVEAKTPAAEATTTVSYTVSFSAGDHGSLTGTAEQAVPPGGDTAPVRAVPEDGYHFEQWLRAGAFYSADNPLTVTAVNEEMTVTAEFAISTHTVTFQPGEHGSLVGGTPAVTVTVNHGDPAPAAPMVTPEAGWLFAGWSPVLPETITANMETTAQYAAADAVAPDGDFLAVVDAAAVISGRGIWDMTGSYTPTAKGSLRSLNLIHDPAGSLSGTATYAVAEDTVVTMPIKGNVKGTSGSITMKGTMRGAAPAKTVTVSLTLNLTVDTANRQLAGRLTGSTRAGRVSTAVNDAVVLDIPADMDGTWTLAFQLHQAGKKVTGTATLTLSNTVDYAFVVQGRVSGAKAVLSLSGNPRDPAANAIKIKTTITPLEAGWARLESFSGKGYGQTLGW